MENKFKIGDVVYLNSEPELKMTINNIDGENIKCVYFVNHQLTYDTFNYTMLTKHNNTLPSFY